MNVETASMFELLEMYETSSPLFLASPRHTLMTQGVRAVVEIEGGKGQWGVLPDRFRSTFNDIGARVDGRPAVIVGALPFDENLPAHFVIPEWVRWAAPLSAAPVIAGASAMATVFDARAVPDAAFYLNGVSKVIERIRNTDLKKVVLARSLELTTSTRIDVATLLRNLLRRNKGAYTFGVDVSGRLRNGCLGSTRTPRGERTLIGASPELLISRSNLDVVSNPLGGSVPRSVETVEDRRRASDLLRSQKDRREHAFVVEAVVEGLRPLCSDLRVPKEPSLLATTTMWHLSTRVRGRVRDPSTCALRLATALHPTPAVCGTPRDEALSVIREAEGFNRGFYAGLIGWSDATGDGEWVVAIRCGEVEDRSIRIFAGAGVVEGSHPEEELAETSAKFRTLLSALEPET